MSLEFNWQNTHFKKKKHNMALLIYIKHFSDISDKIVNVHRLYRDFVTGCFLKKFFCLYMFYPFLNYYIRLTKHTDNKN